MKRFLWLCVIVVLFLICTGCGDTFRPVIIPNPPKFPDPRASHSVIAINDNNTDNSTDPPTSDRGSIMSINVSGDTVVGVTDVGFAPVHAVQQTANQVLVVNQSVREAIGDSLTKVSFSGTQISNATTISLPPDSAPNFVASTESGTAYVLLPGLVPPSVGVVNTATNTLVLTIPVQNDPVAVVETPDAKKLYVANNGSNTVSNFNTIDHTPRNSSPIALSSAPLWIASRSDSQRVFVLESSGNLATLDTTSTAGPDTVTESAVTAAGATYMVYDGRLNRLYIPSGLGNAAQLAVVDVSPSLPPAPVVVTIPTVAPSARGALDPCATTTPTALNAVSAAALPDGSRVYVGAYYVDGAGNICPQVTAINTSSNTIKTSTAVPGFPGFFPFSPPLCETTRFRFMMAAGGDSSRVYLSSCDGGNVNVIDTSTDTYLLNLKAPGSSRLPINGNQPPPQNPVFLFAGP
jgi:DNA-binding beta-propeller fold protein YncE